MEPQFSVCGGRAEWSPVVVRHFGEMDALVDLYVRVTLVPVKVSVHDASQKAIQKPEGR